MNRVCYRGNSLQRLDSRDWRCTGSAGYTLYRASTEIAGAETGSLAIDTSFTVATNKHLCLILPKLQPQNGDVRVRNLQSDLVRLVVLRK